ncbi:MAG: ComEC/Rec2 family competence protein [Muribaculaceae bacterium]|nr:ComEC/Rec2 family competence protein [Muribaculaceae bacterium]
MELSKIPVLRIVVPLAVGILVHGWWHCWWAPLAIIIAAIAFYLWLQVKSRTPQGRLRWRAFYILPLAMAAMALGWLAAVVHCPSHLNESQLTGRNLTGRITGVEYTDFSMRLSVDILDDDVPPCHVLVSTRGCDYSMRAGDIITWPAALDEVGTMGNPDEMDYARYLLHNQGVRYQQHLPAGQLKKNGHSLTVMSSLANYRRHLQQLVFDSQLSPGAQRFVVALLLGNSHLIDKATRQEFSAAGVAHVLALSGLHVGFISLIIWLLLFPLDYLRLKRVRLGITLAAIITFAVFTGLSPSVVRSTVMIGFVFASLIFSRRSVSLNALAMAALIILVFSPSSLYSVGFQLSFVTVCAVLLFARVPAWLESRYRWVNRLTLTIMTSIVAMLATVALTAHYFHTISLTAVITNLLVLPVLPLFMVLGALFLLVTAATMQWSALDWLLDTIYRYIHWTTSTVAAWPASHLGGAYVSATGVVAYFVVMALVILWIGHRNYRYLLAAGCVLALMLGHSLWIDTHTPSEGLVVFNSYTSTPIVYYNQGMAHVWTPDDEEPDSAAFARFHAGFLARHGIGTLRFITGDTVVRPNGNTLFKPPLALVMGQRLVAVGSGKWNSMTASSPLDLDAVIVTKRFHGSISRLQELYRFKRIIISGAMYKDDIGQLLHESDSLSFAVHQLGSQGAYCIPEVK